MKRLVLLFLVFICMGSLDAQTLYTVNSGNFYYTPSTLTITLGDTVQWVNDGGFHDVNANISTLTGSSYNNPESFASTATSGGILLTRVFTVAGTYNYDCTVGAHAANGMTGTVIVNLPAPVMHTVNSGNFYYTPSTLTINVGDTVQWVNDGGFHDVNANISTLTGSSYNNPESFASTATSGGVLLTRVFTVAGTYNYDCTVGAHAANGMTGTVIVNSLATSTPQIAKEKINSLTAFYTGSSQEIQLNFDLEKTPNSTAVLVFDMAGQVVKSTTLGAVKGENLHSLNFEATIPRGIYVVSLQVDGLIQSRKVAIY